MEFPPLGNSLSGLGASPLRTFFHIAANIYRSKVALAKMEDEYELLSNVDNFLHCKREITWFTPLKSYQI